ncbi:LmbU family transcriptional regulator [Nocardia terpenica]|uniref:LmbU family transcriptional regulator n=1 Tax=Nocardia terpenica TaxID=455432 RepID=UPI0022B77F60|nr:LmbU family transcriptional regulator [Nocardia terpenica]
MTRSQLADPKAILVTQVGLLFPNRMAYAQWERAGRKLAHISSSSTWCLGDWLVYGEKSYADRYRVAVEAVGLDYQTLRNYAWVCRRFVPERRRRELSFQHHAEVASLGDAEQDRWLDLATEHQWSRNKLRERVRGHRARPVTRGSDRELVPGVRARAEQMQRWALAAARSEASLVEWASRTLDQAAEMALAQPNRLAEEPEAHPAAE